MNITADDAFVLMFNNHYIGWGYMPESSACGVGQPPTEYSYIIPASLLQQVNEINITAQNHALPCDPTPNNAGVIYRLSIDYVNCCPNTTVFNPSSPTTGICNNLPLKETTDLDTLAAPAPTPRSIWPFSFFGGT
jgi:hypothetical protein